MLLLIISPNSLKINLTNTLNLLGVLNLCNKITRDANRIKISIGVLLIKIKSLKQRYSYNYMHSIA